MIACIYIYKFYFDNLCNFCQNVENLFYKWEGAEK